MRTALAAMAIGMLASDNHHPAQIGLLHEVSVKNREREEAHQRSNAAASLRHLQPHRRKQDHVALAQNRHAEPGKQIAGQFRGKIWSGKVIWLKMIAGNGMASSRTSSAKRSSFKSCQPPKLSANPPENQQRNPRKKKLRAVDPQKQNDQPQSDHGNPAPYRSNSTLSRVFLFSQIKKAAKMGTRNRVKNRVLVPILTSLPRT